MDASEQRRQRRALAGVLVGALVLGAVGVVGAILVTSGPCEDLLPPGPSPEAVADGSEVLAEVAPDADLPAIAADVVALGEELGLGPVRGATASLADVTLVPFDEGTYVVADDDHVRIIDTAIIAVASGRERRPDVDLRPAGDQVGVVVSEDDRDTLIARYDGDLKLQACRELDGEARVVHLSGGVAVLSSGRDVDVARLDGGSLWRASEVLTDPVSDAAVTGRLALVASTSEVAAFDLRSGEPVWRVTSAEVGGALSEDAILLAGDDVVFLSSAAGIARVDGEDGTLLGVTPTGETPTDAVATTDGVVVAAGSRLVRFTSQGETADAALPGAPTSPLVARGGDVMTTTDAGAVRVRPDGTVTTGPDLPATAIGVSEGYTVVAFDVGAGFLAFYGPAPR